MCKFLSTAAITATWGTFASVTAWKHLGKQNETNLLTRVFNGERSKEHTGRSGSCFTNGNMPLVTAATGTNKATFIHCHCTSWPPILIFYKECVRSWSQKVWEKKNHIAVKAIPVFAVRQTEENRNPWAWKASAHSSHSQPPGRDMLASQGDISKGVISSQLWKIQLWSSNVLFIDCCGQYHCANKLNTVYCSGQAFLSLLQKPSYFEKHSFKTISLFKAWQQTNKSPSYMQRLVQPKWEERDKSSPSGHLLHHSA